MSRLQAKLIKKLKLDLPDFDWDNATFCIPRGYWRSSPYADVYRWEVFVSEDGYEMKRHYGCWSTMTNSVSKKTKLTINSTIIKEIEVI